jgi:hypothetical protein
MKFSSLYAKLFRKNSFYEPPLPPWEDFFCLVHVLEKRTIYSQGELLPSSETIGYFQNVGVRLDPAFLQQQLQELYGIEQIDWEKTECNLCDLRGLSRNIRKRCLPIKEKGIFYKSGRSYYEN